jgi:hypothetical protein
MHVRLGNFSESTINQLVSTHTCQPFALHLTFMLEQTEEMFHMPDQAADSDVSMGRGLKSLIISLFCSQASVDSFCTPHLYR